jgi:hypothetical protein
LLHESAAARIAEIAVLFAVAGIVIAIGLRRAGDNPLARQGVV